MDQATRELIEQHLPLVEHMVLRLAAGFPRHIDRSELVSAGVVGLTEAAIRFEPDRGIAFAAFAGRRIRGAVLDTMRASDWAPRSVRASARATEAVEQELASRLGRSPHAHEVAEEAGMTVRELDQLRTRIDRGVVMALDRSYGEDAEPMVANLVDPGASDPLESVESAERRAYLRDAVGALPERHRAVIVGYFLEGRTSQEIADELGITQSRVSQLRADALEMLKEGIDAQYEAKASEPPVGRVARRKSRYAAAIASSSSFAARLSVSELWAEQEGRADTLLSEA